MAVGPDGALYITNSGGSEYRPGSFLSFGPAHDYNGGYIQRLDPTTGAVRTLYTHCGPHKLSSPNDLVFDRHGGFYFSDTGKKRDRDRDLGAVYYALPDGSKIEEIAYHVPLANGVGLSPDQKTLYVADTEAARIWAWDIVGPGKIRKNPVHPPPHGGRLICGLPGFQWFDSLALEANGNICVGTLVTGCITVIAPDGRIVRQVKMPDSFPTNICFGGPDLKTAYVTLGETGSLLAMDWPEPGLPLNFNT